jgi:diacylglycerol kinase
VAAGDGHGRAFPLGSLARLGRSFVKAFAGIGLLLREPNARIHVAAALTVVAAGRLVGLDPLEWAVIALNIGFVLALETLNTALEGYVDLAAPGRDEVAARAKDAAAGAVLIAATTSVLVAALVFGPRLGELGTALLLAWRLRPGLSAAYAAAVLGFLLSGVLWRGKWPPR